MSKTSLTVKPHPLTPTQSVGLALAGCSKGVYLRLRKWSCQTDLGAGADADAGRVASSFGGFLFYEL